MEIGTIRGNIAIDFVEDGRLYTLIITPLQDGYIDWQVSQDYETMMTRYGLYVPAFKSLVEDLIQEAIPSLK